MGEENEKDVLTKIWIGKYSIYDWETIGLLNAVKYQNKRRKIRITRFWDINAKRAKIFIE